MIDKKAAYRLLKKLLLYYLLILLSQYELDLQACIRSARNSDGAKKRGKKVRVLWSEVSLRISDMHLTDWKLWRIDWVTVWILRLFTGRSNVLRTTAWSWMGERRSSNWVDHVLQIESIVCHKMTSTVEITRMYRRFSWRSTVLVVVVVVVLRLLIDFKHYSSNMFIIQI